MATVDPIKISGLSPFRAGLGRMEAGTEGALRRAQTAAADVVVATAARRVPTYTGAARRSLRAVSGKVTGGGPSAPYFGWLDYGGKRPGRGGGQASRPWIARGRFIYPALTSEDEEITDLLAGQLADLARDAGLEVSGA
jgi:hypothetical protein